MSDTQVYDFEAQTLDGAPAPLADYRGKVLLIVNTASKCGFTPQYKGLESLWEKYRDRGLVVLGFPCNQFGSQEPGDAAEIASFCSLTYDVKFPMMAKIEVNGPKAHPLYAWLKSQKKGLLGSEAIKWNFTKFLIDRNGQVIGRFGSNVEPKDLERAIEAAL
jgi:glutathione peroxidase